jgi:hypothetical protein
MASDRAPVRPRCLAAGGLLLAALLASCSGRPPVLVPPAGGVDAVEGYAFASISGAEASIKGRFAFLFRRPGRGRVEAVDPLGRTVFLVYFRDGRAWFVLPSRKVYSEADADIMMDRFLGIAFRPDETLSLLSGIWPAAGEEGGWSVERDAQGRVRHGERSGFSFAVRSFFRGGGAPRELALAGAGTSGRLKILRLAFNPVRRDEAFDVAFLGRYAARTWEEILELLDR